MTSIVGRATASLFFLCHSLMVLSYQNLPIGYPESPRSKVNINTSWSFYLQEDSDTDIHELKSKLPKDNSSSWSEVAIPHGLELFTNDMNGSEDDPYQLSFQRKVGWYQRKINIDPQRGEKIFLEFEGVHQVSNLWINGKHIGEHSIGGYTPFSFEITNWIERGENTILVSADNRVNEDVPPDGDQYDYIKFGGLYRDVYLVKTDDVHITFPWESLSSGIHITQPSVNKEDASINIKTNVLNDGKLAADCKVVSRIIDRDGVVVLKLEKESTILPHQSKTFSQTGGINKHLHLWSPSSPYLYRVNVQVFKNGKLVDMMEEPLGLRWFEFRTNEGFFLNGENIELVGANRHQAYPFIGDAVPNNLHRKDALQFKEAGFNVVRLAHYPHDNSFIEACDELGILVYEEPPSWIGIGDEKWFDNLELAMRRMIRNHRNHPSILMWGASLNHRGPVERLHYASKEEDPYRPTASNGAPWTGPRNSGVCDLYTPMDYQAVPVSDRELSFLCEHGSSADASRNQFELSRSRASKNRFGVAVWTAHDYHSFKPNRKMYDRRVWSWYRVPNQPFYWYQSELLNRPIIHVGDERISKDGRVVIFSNCQEVILKHNGMKISSQYPDVKSETRHVLHPSFTFDFDWISGEIEAIGMNDGKEIIRQTLKKNSSPYQLSLKVEMDNEPFFADGSTIKMVRAYVQDKEGDLVRMDSSLISFEVEGNGELIGNDLRDANPNRAYYGVATGMLRSHLTPGTIKVTARSTNLKPATIEINTIIQENRDQMIAKARPIFDSQIEMIDVGGEGQFVQFAWQAWTSGSNKQINSGDGNGNVKVMDREQTETPSTSDTYKLSALKGKIVLVDTGHLEWTQNWGQSSNLAYATMDGIKTSGDQVISFRIEDLNPGIYTIKTWHHIAEEKRKIKGKYNIKVTSDDFEKRNRYLLAPTIGRYMEQINPASHEFELEVKDAGEIEIEISSTHPQLPIYLNGISISRRIN